MEHITEIQLIEFAAGNLPTETASHIDAHLKQCPACVEALNEIKMAFDAANSWQPEIEITDTPQQFAQKVIAQSVKQRSLSIRSKIIQTSFRYAASILIAVAIGATLGNKSVSKESDIQSNQNNPEYLAALSMQFSSDLTWTILENDQPQQEDSK